MKSTTLLTSIKRLTLLLALIFISHKGFSQSDSCYVYTQIRWSATPLKYVAKVQDVKGDFDVIKDDNGNKLYFNSIMNAINYYSTNGWELLEMYYPKDMISSTDKDQCAVIRKKMPKAEAEKYASPKQ